MSLDILLEGVETSASFALAESYGGYSSKLALEDLTDGKAWIAYRYDGEEVEPEHGGPARLLDQDEPGFWESLGYHNYGDPWREQRFWGGWPEVAMTSANLWTDGDALADPPRRLPCRV